MADGDKAPSTLQNSGPDGPGTADRDAAAPSCSGPPGPTRPLRCLPSTRPASRRPLSRGGSHRRSKRHGPLHDLPDRRPGFWGQGKGRRLGSEFSCGLRCVRWGRAQLTRTRSASSLLPRGPAGPAARGRAPLRAHDPSLAESALSRSAVPGNGTNYRVGLVAPGALFRKQLRRCPSKQLGPNAGAAAQKSRRNPFPSQEGRFKRNACSASTSDPQAHRQRDAPRAHQAGYPGG